MRTAKAFDSARSDPRELAFLRIATAVTKYAAQLPLSVFPASFSPYLLVLPSLICLPVRHARP
jgi:hypothetical protein